MTGKGEWYVLVTPTGNIPLDGTFRPNQLSPTARSTNLVRGRGYRRVFDLHDGLPDPVPITLTGIVWASSEDSLALALRELRKAVRTATMLQRNDRDPIAIAGASMLAVPSGDESNEATVTITLIPAAVPDEASGIYDW